MLRVSALSRDVCASLQTSPAIWNSFHTKLDGIMTELGSASTREDTHWSAVHSALDKSEAAYSNTQMETNTQLQLIATAVGTSRTETRGEFESLDGKCSLILDVVQPLMSAMTIRDEQTGKVLGQLRDQAGAAQLHSSSRMSWDDVLEDEVSSETQREGKAVADIEPIQSIDRLCDLVHNKEQVANTEEIDTIIDDLRVVLTAAQGQSEDAGDIRNLKRICGLFSSAQKMSINKGGETVRLLCSEVHFI